MKNKFNDDFPLQAGLSLYKHNQDISYSATGEVLCISVSLKPAPEKKQPSLTRSLIINAYQNVSKIYPNITTLDLRQNPVPFFDGRLPNEMADENTYKFYHLLLNSKGIFIGIPVYWNAISGSFKNFIELMCGPAYDPRVKGTPFKKKLVSFFIVGDDEESTVYGTQQVTSIFKKLGSEIVGKPLKIANSKKIQEQLPFFNQQVIARLALLTKKVLEIKSKI